MFGRLRLVPQLAEQPAFSALGVHCGMTNLIDETLEHRCLALTGSFETSAGIPDCYCGLAGDFDGMGLSYGVLQWNLGQGTLQPLLSDMLSAHENAITAIFAEHTEALRTMLGGSRDAQLGWARSIQDLSRHAVLDPWKSLLLALGRTPEFQAVQVAHAGRIYQNAVYLCRRFGVNTERALALMFDISVQNGGIDDAVDARIRADFAVIPVDDEVARLQSIANRRAEASNPRYIEDVRERKLTIANGQGMVHNVWYDLAEQFRIGLRSAFA
ncbi:MAG: peptidoglycan-binding protein [Bryobacteraceae bacterium]